MTKVDHSLGAAAPAWWKEQQAAENREALVVQAFATNHAGWYCWIAGTHSSKPHRQARIVGWSKKPGTDTRLIIELLEADATDYTTWYELDAWDHLTAERLGGPGELLCYRILAAVTAWSPPEDWAP